MKIAFASEFLPDNMRAFSGTPYFMSRSIRETVDSFDYIVTPHCNWAATWEGGDEGRSQLLASGRFLTDYLSRADVDAVICQGSSMIPYLTTDKLVVLWHDSTWFSWTRMDFVQFKTRHPRLYEWDHTTLEKCGVVAFAADWLQDQTLRCYGIPQQKIHVLPFGANLYPVSQEIVHQAIMRRDPTYCQLTFLAVNWQLKGLPLAHEVLRRLNASGLCAELTVIGCDVPPPGKKRRFKQFIGMNPLSDIERFQSNFNRDPAVRRAGFLRKDDPEEYDRFCEILQDTHFLLHPAEYESFGIAMADANAFGVPVLATANHGMLTVVREGYNGYLYERSDYVRGAADLILRQMKDIDGYRSLAMSAFAEYRDRLNWTQSARQLTEILRGNENAGGHKESACAGS